MKYLKEYTEKDIEELNLDLSEIGASDWKGFFITLKISSTSTGTSDAIFIVSENMKNLAIDFFGIFGIDPEDIDIDIEKISSIEEILSSIGDYYSNDMSDMLNEFEYIYTEMSPKKLEKYSNSIDLLLFGEVLKEGKEVFSNFESKLSGHKAYHN